MESCRVLTITVFMVLCVGCSEFVSRDYVASTTAEVVRGIEAGRWHEVASQMHYPPQWSADQRAVDENRNARLLEFVIQRFGTPHEWAATKSGLFIKYQVGVMGGTIEYWDSLAVVGTARSSFEVEFEKLGPGFVALDYFENSDEYGLKRIVVGLDARTAGVRDTIVRIATDLVEFDAKYESLMVPENLERRLDEALPKVFDD